MEFRQACYLIFGWKMDLAVPGVYRLSSMFAESETDHLLFKIKELGQDKPNELQLEILPTEFSNQVSDKIEMYLQKMNSYPAFLSAITMDLFERQTQTIFRK